jgi:hypothetical protein
MSFLKSGRGQAQDGVRDTWASAHPPPRFIQVTQATALGSKDFKPTVRHISGALLPRGS